MSKTEILDYFKDINVAYNDCSRHDSLSNMISEFEQEIRAKTIDEFAEKANKKISEFILNHQEQLTFVSGVSMGWNIIDEIAEQMKE